MSEQTLAPQGAQRTAYGTPKALVAVRPASGDAAAFGGNAYLILHVAHLSNPSPIGYGRLRVRRADDPEEVNASWQTTASGGGEGAGGAAGSERTLRVARTGGKFKAGAAQVLRDARRIHPQHGCACGLLQTGRVRVQQG